ncbi:MAG TPA: hypothetical protein VEU30_02450 [Thermoanaerobaculia bacterium]|nr:hypothetical protein [Thermoanaerobaculia bacterium]
MLKIRGEQLAALQASMEERFVTRMQEHAREWFPAACAVLTLEELTARIRNGIARARGYGFTSEEDHCRFIDLSFVLGEHFDDDPALPWVAEILGQRAASPGDTMRFLYAEAQQRLAPRPQRMPVEP